MGDIYDLLFKIIFSAKVIDTIRKLPTIIKLAGTHHR